MPSALSLGSMYPNPVAGSARINYGLPTAMNVRVSIYDLQGKIVATLVDGNKKAGYHQIMWDLRTMSGNRLGVGTYLCRLTAGTRSLVKRFVVER